MAAPAAPAPPVGAPSAAGIKPAGAGAARAAAAADSRPVVLCLASASYDFHDMLPAAEFALVLFTTQTRAASMDGFVRRKYLSLAEWPAPAGSLFQHSDVETCAVALQASLAPRPISAVVCLEEQGMICAARVREALGMSASPYLLDATLRFRDKLVMKRLLAPLADRLGVRIPNFIPVQSACDIIAFFERSGGKCVVKPALGYGSVGAAVLDSPEALHRYLEDQLPRAAAGHCDATLGLEVESFVAGPMFHIDGLVVDGIVRCVCPSRYMAAVVAYQTNPFIAGYSLAVGNPLRARMQQAACDILLALRGPQTYPFHLELWHTPDDAIAFCEVAARTGGGGIPAQVLTLYGLDLNRVFARAQAGQSTWGPNVSQVWHERAQLQPGCCGWIFVYPQQGVLRSAPRSAPPPFVVLFESAPLGTRFAGRADCAHYAASMIVTGDDEDSVQRNLLAAHEWFAAGAVWE